MADDRAVRALDELERLAKVATPGPWTSRVNETTVRGPQFVVASAHGPISEATPNCEFISAANPATVLALVEVARAALRLTMQNGPGGYVVAFQDMKDALAKLGGSDAQ